MSARRDLDAAEVALIGYGAVEGGGMMLVAFAANAFWAPVLFVGGAMIASVCITSALRLRRGRYGMRGGWRA